MKRIILFCTFLMLVLYSSSQIRPQSFDSANGRELIEGEKRAYNELLRGSNANNRTASSGNFDINFYRCEWYIDPAVRYISGKVTSFFTITDASDNITFDLSDTLNVDSIIHHGSTIGFQRIANDGLIIQFPAILMAGQADSVSIYYHGVPKNRISFKPFNQALHNGVYVISTLSEPYGAKDWWPCKNGLTDKADSIDILITSPAAYKGVSNGLLISDTIAGSNRTLFYKHRYPIATYLVAVSVTNYVTEKDSVFISNKIMPVIKHYYPESIYDMETASYTAKICLQKFSGLFGDYPFIKEQYSQTQWSIGGGMEHQTNSFIKGTGVQLIAHELGHQWFGDMVTCSSWQHIWLNEGFGDYMQYIYVENFDSTIKLIHLNAHLNGALADSSGSVFVTDTTNPARVFDGHTYYKGGYVLHMLRGMLGDTLFFSGLRKYLNDPLLKYKFAVTEDLERNFEQVSGRDLHSFFKKWIYGEGYPNYSITWFQNNNNWAQVQINQTTTHPSVSFYEMPVQLKFKNNTRDTIITVNHQYSGQVFWIDPGFKADTMIIDPYLWIMSKEKKVQKQVIQSILPDFIKIYPNPAPGILNISVQNPATKKINIKLYNAAGQLAYQVDHMTEGRDELIPVPTSLLPHGVYIIKVSDNKKTLATKKIMH
ncbi:MAG: M1 family aminopeptidase [Bacteroidota bacterium]